MEKINPPNTLDEVSELIKKYPEFQKIAEHVQKRVRKLMESGSEDDNLFDSFLIEDEDVLKLAENLPPGLEEKIIFVWQKLVRSIIEGDIA